MEEHEKVECAQAVTIAKTFLLLSSIMTDGSEDLHRFNNSEKYRSLIEHVEHTDDLSPMAITLQRAVDSNRGYIVPSQILIQMVAEKFPDRMQVFSGFILDGLKSEDPVVRSMAIQTEKLINNAGISPSRNENSTSTFASFPSAEIN